MTTDSPEVAEGGRLAIALSRAWQNDDRPAQIALLKQIAEQHLTAGVLLAQTAMLVNLVALSASELQCSHDEMWHTLLVLHGEART